MTRHIPPDWLDPKGAPFLLAVERGNPSLGSTLLGNAARRSFLRLFSLTDLREPDWTHWMQEIGRTKYLPAQDLLTPERHITCSLLEDFYRSSTPLVRDIYRRAFLIEIEANIAIYFDFLQTCGVPDYILHALQARCAHDSLLRTLEDLLQHEQTGAINAARSHPSKMKI